MNIQTATPKEIDNKLAEIYGRLNSIRTALRMNDAAIKNLEKRRPKEGETGPNVNSFHRAMKHYEEQGQRLRDSEQDAEAETTPYEDEYKARGRWSRAFLVVSSQGHVHNTLGCSTCNWKTQYAWLPDYSGETEERLIEDAGERLCSVCFPHAPVDTWNRPTKIELPERKAAREAREKEKAARDAERVRKGILTPEGGEIRVPGNYGVVKAERTAQTLLIDSLVTIALVEGPGLGYRNVEYAAQVEREAREGVAILLPALAYKRGQSEDEVRESVTSKVAAKVRKYRS